MYGAKGFKKRICARREIKLPCHANDGAKTNPTSLVSSIHGTVEDSIRALQPKGQWHAVPCQRQLHPKLRIVGLPHSKEAFTRNSAAKRSIGTPCHANGKPFQTSRKPLVLPKTDIPRQSVRGRNDALPCPATAGRSGRPVFCRSLPECPPAAAGTPFVHYISACGSNRRGRLPNREVPRKATKTRNKK